VSILSTKPSNTTDILFGAPGYGLSSTYYGIISGTSMATPQVSGLAALLLSYNSSLTWQQVKDAIMNNVDPIGPLSGITVTGGKINAFNALNSVSQDNNYFKMENKGNATLTINSISDDKPWLTTDGYPATPFDLEPSGSQIVTCSVDWNQLSTEESGIVTINSNDPDENQVYVNVTAYPLTQEFITVTFPNEPGSFQAGQDMTITWYSENSSGNVSIDYSINGGSSWQSVIDSTTDDGSYHWRVPNESSTNCFVQITDTDGSPSDMSDSPFTITSGDIHFTFYPTEDYYPIIIENITLDGQPLVTGDEVGVFFRDDNNNLVCGGSIVWPYSGMEAWGDDSQTSDKDGFVAGEELFFRVWDASSQMEYGPPFTENYLAGNGIWGNGPFAQISLMEFRESCSITIDLVEGWNWTSINVNPFVSAVVNMWTGITCLEILKSYTGFYVPGIFDGIGDWDYKQMYTAYLTCAPSLNIEGQCVDPSEPTVLLQDWNWVSYLPDQPIPIETALASCMDYINIVKAYDGFFVPGVWDGIGDMEPGEGFKMHLSQECILTYPSGGVIVKRSGSERSAVVTGAICSHFSDFKTTEDYQALLIQSREGNGIDLETGDEIGIYTESGLCIGGAVLTDEYPLGMMAWMDDPRTEEVDGFKSGEQMVAKYWDASEDIEYNVSFVIEKGTDRLGESELTEVSLAADVLTAPNSSPMPTSYTMEQNYPNPFNPETTIRYGIPEAGTIRLTVYNIEGRVIKHLDSGYKEAGYHKVNWDGENEYGKSVSSGVYIYRIEAGEFSNVRKMIFIK
jgi:hypothetical protein